MAIEQWVLDNDLTFNISKCSYMMKRFPTTPLHPLMLNGLHLNKVLNILVYFSPLISPGPHTLCQCVLKLNKF